MELPMPDGPNKAMWLALIEHDNDRLVSALMDGADPNFPDEVGLAPVMLAVMCENVGAVEVLRAFGATYPAPAEGSWFDAYFDIKPPKYPVRQVQHASVIAIKSGDEDFVQAVLDLPGSASGFAPGGVVRPVNGPRVSNCRVPEGFHDRYKACFPDIAYKAAEASLSKTGPLTAGSKSILRDAVSRFLIPLHGKVERHGYLLPDEVVLHSATEHIVDRQNYHGADFGSVKSIAFSMEGEFGGISMESLTKEFVADVNEGTRRELGVVRLSDNSVVHMYIEDCAKDEIVDEEDPFGPPLQSESRNRYVGGAIFFSEDVASLNLYLECVGSPTATIDLINAITDDDYEATKAAILNNADTSLSFLGGRAADVIAVLSPNGSALKALIEHDPITRLRLQRDRFDLESPLIAALIRSASSFTIREPMTNLVIASHIRSEWNALHGTVKYLIDAGVNVNAADGHSCRALEVALLTSGNVFAQMLLEADAEYKDLTSGSSPVFSQLSDPMRALLAAWQAKQVFRSATSRRSAQPVVI